jgi:RNA polymerase sigma factor (sigma-70 family)
MSDVTRILSQIDAGDSGAADKLLPLIYEELKNLAMARLARERAGHTLSATSLVHEAYLRLVESERSEVRSQTSEELELTSDPRPPTSARWDSRGHFFAAAAEAMRRILVEAARAKASAKRGGDFERIELSEVARTEAGDPLDLLALDEALAELETTHPEKAQIVKLRFFAGLSLEDAAQAAGISRATAQRHWTYARAWLFGRLRDH